MNCFWCGRDKCSYQPCGDNLGEQLIIRAHPLEQTELFDPFDNWPESWSESDAWPEG